MHRPILTQYAARADSAAQFIHHPFGAIILPSNPEAQFMQTRKPIDIPVVTSAVEEDTAQGSNCSGNELVALMALGDSMQPEFMEGEILVIEMNRPAMPGDYVIAEVAKEDFIFRQLMRDDKGGWQLHALNPVYPDTAIPDLSIIKGVVIHKRHPRSRKTVKFYVGQGA